MSRLAHEVLSAAIEGNAITQAEALSLVNEAKLEDLLLAADLLRRRVFREECISVRQLIDGTKPIKENNLPKRFKLCPERFASLKPYEELFLTLEGLPVEFSDLEGLLALAQKKQMSYFNLVKRLAKAGLRTVYVDDDALLQKQKYQELWSIFNEAGIRIAFKIKLDESWDKSLLKLSKLKKLQEKNCGISYIEIPEPIDAASIRFACISRLFLDNIPSIAIATESRNLQSELALISGVNEIILER